MTKKERAIRRAVLREVKKKWDAAACTFDKWLNAQVKKPKKKF
jgi:oligoendopeptidase F